MNEFLKFIKDRRSIREFLDKPIEKKKLEEIVDSARLAPSARNIQPWKFLVVTERETLKKVSEFVSWGSFIGKSAACIVVCGRKDVKRRVEDCCLSAENIMLSAKSLGIGSCYVAALGKDMDQARNLLNVPEDLEIVCFIPLGYFEKNPEPHDKKRMEEIIMWERF
jgi:nitroreductase